MTDHELGMLAFDLMAENATKGLREAKINVGAGIHKALGVKVGEANPVNIEALAKKCFMLGGIMSCGLHESEHEWFKRATGEYAAAIREALGQKEES